MLDNNSDPLVIVKKTTIKKELIMTEKDGRTVTNLDNLEVNVLSSEENTIAILKEDAKKQTSSINEVGGNPLSQNSRFEYTK